MIYVRYHNICIRINGTEGDVFVFFQKRSMAINFWGEEGGLINLSRKSHMLITRDSQSYIHQTFCLKQSVMDILCSSPMPSIMFFAIHLIVEDYNFIIFLLYNKCGLV